MGTDLWLVICGVAQSAGRFRIREGCNEIGRAERCDIRLEDWSVSRSHAMLARDGRRLHVRDLLSQNGTFVNGKPVKSAAVAVGNSLRFGRVTLDVVDAGACRSRRAADDEATPPAPVAQAGDAQIRAAHLPPATKRVCSLLLEGLAEKQIAARLHVSQTTVHGHVEEIYKKFGVHSRAELAALFRTAETVPFTRISSAS